MTHTGTATELVIVRTLPAPPANVFAAWTDPGRMAQWWGTSDFTGTACEIDLRAGGAWRACMTSPAGEEHWSGGTYCIIDPPSRLSFTFAWEGAAGPPSEIDITFVGSGTGTEMTLRQRLAVSAETFEGYRTGWEETFDRLGAYVSPS
jgi:uncharacterized protein YndB with AHSA1/START domain